MTTADVKQVLNELRAELAGLDRRSEGVDRLPQRVEADLDAGTELDQRVVDSLIPALVNLRDRLTEAGTDAGEIFRQLAHQLSVGTAGSGRGETS